MDKKEKEKPWWLPKFEVDEEWIKDARNKYPEDTKGVSDSKVVDMFYGGDKYADKWEYLCDARESYEALADAYLELLEKVNK